VADKKVALLIFSKPPIPGLVKTRLTIQNGGIFTPELAADLFRRCLYDVTELSMHALIELQWDNDAQVAANPEADRIIYDLFVSTTPAENLELMKQTFDEIGPWPMEIHYLVDSGSTFDDHFDDAIRQIFELGYESFVAISADIPTLPKSHLKQSFQWLNYFQAQGTPGFIMAPCQECGTSMIGFSYNTPIDNQGVYYNLNGRPALDAYVVKMQEANIPGAYFSPIADIDESEDLAHAISCLRAIKQCAPFQSDLFVANRVIDWCDAMGVKASTPPNEEHDPRQYFDGQELEDLY